jgi:hypothetical protein
MDFLPAVGLRGETYGQRDRLSATGKGEMKRNKNTHRPSLRDLHLGENDTGGLVLEREIAHKLFLKREIETRRRGETEEGKKRTSR